MTTSKSNHNKKHDIYIQSKTIFSDQIIPSSNHGSVCTSIHIYCDGSFTNNIIQEGGTLYVSQSGKATDNIVNKGASIILSEQGKASENIIQGGILSVNKNGNANHNIIKAGGYLHVASKGQANHNVVNHSGTMTISSGGKAYCNTVHSKGKIIVKQAGEAVSNTIMPHGKLTVHNQAILVDTTIEQNGELIILKGGYSSNTVLQHNASLSIRNGGRANNIILQDGILHLSSGANVNNITAIDQTGTIILHHGNSWGHEQITQTTKAISLTKLIIQSGASLSKPVIGSNISVTIQQDALVIDPNVISGGYLSLEENAILQGILTIQDNGYVEIPATFQGTVRLSGQGGSTLYISNIEEEQTTDMQITVEGFSGASPYQSDKIILSDIPQDFIDFIQILKNDKIRINLKNKHTITFTLVGIKTFKLPLIYSHMGLVFGEPIIPQTPKIPIINTQTYHNHHFDVSIRAGTLIDTADTKFLPIEQIKIGDLIKTFDWKRQQDNYSKVIWIGKKRINTHVDKSSNNYLNYPIRIKKNALAENKPNQDLWVASEQCLFFNNQLVPTKMLVNNRSIFYDLSSLPYDYYHIELEEHSIITANNLLTESYLNTNNRDIFDNYNTIIQPNIPNRSLHCAATVTFSRQIIEPIFNILEKRAKTLKYKSQIPSQKKTKDKNVYLITNTGQKLHNIWSDNERYVFALSPEVKNVRIISNATRPSDLGGPFIDDHRNLGILIKTVTLFNDGELKTITQHLTDPDLLGWQDIDDPTCRWTNGNAFLSILTDKIRTQEAILSLEIIDGGPYLIPKKTKCNKTTSKK